MSRKASVFNLTLFSIVSCMFLWIVCLHSGNSNFQEASAFLNGPVGDYYSPIEIMWWIFLLTPVWAGCGWLIDKESTQAHLSLYRYGSARIWWFKFTGKIGALHTWYFILFGLLSRIVVEGRLSGAYFLRLVVVMLHSLVMVVTMIWIYILSQHIVLAFAILIVLESTAKMFIMLGISLYYMPLVWGMYGYSDKFYTTGGFSWPISAVIQIAYSLAVVIVPLFLKKLILRSVRL